jgi:anti-sigma factor RsiW
MPPTVPQHPTATDLTAFALGKLTPAAADWIARHLEECPTCRTVAEKASDDRLVGLLRGPDGPAPTPSGHGSETAGDFPAPIAAPADVPAALRDHPRQARDHHRQRRDDGGRGRRGAAGRRGDRLAAARPRFAAGDLTGVPARP